MSKLKERNAWEGGAADDESSSNFPRTGSAVCRDGQRAGRQICFCRTRFAEASDAAGVDLLKLCAEGPLDRLTMTATAQPAILASSYIAFEALQQETGLEPSLLAV